MTKPTEQSLCQLDDVPAMCCGAPMPAVVSSEGELSVYYLQSQAIADEMESNLPTPRSVVVELKFTYVLWYCSGTPNDEAINGHPLYKIGLTAYTVAQVQQSELIGRLCQQNAVHSRHNPSVFERYRHFILTFHDSTIEVVAEQYEVIVHNNSSMVGAMTNTIDGWN